jgi:hypothetical protein
MSEPLDRLCSELRSKLHRIDRKLEAVQGHAMGVSGASRHAIESQLGRIEQAIDDNRIIVAAANARVQAWLEGKKDGYHAKDAGWNENRRLHLLNTRADDAEAYAGAVFDLAAAAADEAAQAALQALLARDDAQLAALPEDWAADE